MSKRLGKRWLAMAGLILIGGMAGYAVLKQRQPLRLQEQIGQAEQQWQARHIARYRIQVQQASLWHLERYTITVAHGTVVDQSATCSPAPIEGRACTVRPFTATAYTVDGLFDTARSVAEEVPAGVTITFDPTYGFPASIRSAPPNLVDADQSWQVLSFAVLN